jgi:transaldolase/glucose-6-phosphate isomerase
MLYADPRNAAELGRHNSLSVYLKRYLGRARADDYVALPAYVAQREPHTRMLTAMRVRDKMGVAACLDLGPRVQYSTGLVYKSVPNSGAFLHITCGDPADIDVPGHTYGFGLVKGARARGGVDALVQRGRRALRVHHNDVDAGFHATDAALA